MDRQDYSARAGSTTVATALYTPSLTGVSAARKTIKPRMFNAPIADCRHAGLRINYRKFLGRFHEGQFVGSPRGSPAFAHAMTNCGENTFNSISCCARFGPGLLPQTLIDSIRNPWRRPSNSCGIGSSSWNLRCKGTSQKVPGPALCTRYVTISLNFAAPAG